MEDDLPIHPLVTLLDQHLDATLDRSEKGLAPVWESQFQMGRTLITLSSSALVLSISVTQFLASKPVLPKSGWLLPASWVLFGVTVLTGAARQSWAGAARSFRIQLEGKRSEMRERVAELSADDPDLSDKFDAIVEKAMQDANIHPQKAVKVHDALNQVMFWAFAGGLGALLLFAIRNLPF